MPAEQRDHTVRIEDSPKRVRAFLAGQVVVDTTGAALVWEHSYYPTYYVPAGDVRAALVATGSTDHSPTLGEATLYDVSVPGTATAAAAARRYHDSPLEPLRDLVRLDWPAMDEWFEEDEPVYVHPRDPYTRVDILASSRRVRVELDGVVVAESGQPRILYETGLPPRYYLPLTDLRMDLLRPSGKQSACPYKGTASYWSVAVNGKLYEDLVWTYRSPLPESQKIAGLACFYNERVDLHVDGVALRRPRTHFA